MVLNFAEVIEADHVNASLKCNTIHYVSMAVMDVGRTGWIRCHCEARYTCDLLFASYIPMCVHVHIDMIHYRS